VRRTVVLGHARCEGLDELGGVVVREAREQLVQPAQGVAAEHEHVPAEDLGVG